MDLSTRSAHKYLNQCRQTVNQSRSFIFDQIGSTYRIIPIFQYSGETKPAYTDLQGPPVHIRRDETLGRPEKRSKIRKQRYASRPRAMALSGGFIHQSRRGCIYCPRSRTELFDAFHGSVKNTTFWLTHDSERPYEPREEIAVGINARARSQYEARRDVSQLKIVVELFSELHLANIVA